MNVKQSVLEAKADKELEEYIKEGNRFVPEANRLAFEILKSRGRIFSEKETKQIMFMISEKSKIKENVIHQNHKKAANLIYFSAALGVVNTLLSPNIFNNGSELMVVIITLGMIVGAGYLISKGNDWVKYFLLISALIGLPFIFSNIVNHTVIDIINIVQTVVQIYAIVLLFKIPKKTR